MKRRPFLTSRTVTRAAFGVIIVFVLAQVVWWIIFQNRYISGVTQDTLAAWQQDVGAANDAVKNAANPTLVRALEADYPHLLFDEMAGTFMLDPAVVAAFTNRQNGFIRMVAFEGPFFVLVVLTGLYIIAKSLRTERELKRRQQNFLSAITHEFKTPLSTLRLLIETVLMRSLPPEKQRDYLSRMEGELTRLESTSEQVLAAARLEQSRTTTLLEPLEMNSAVQGVVGRLRAGLEARGALLDVVYSPEPLPVSIDSSAFGVVLGNLLDNAVKYSPGAEKIVTVRLERQRDLVLTHVEDRGVGISEVERKRVFERFYRVGSEMTRRSTGVGLGLHLVRSMTEAMNGWVRLEANHPQGTRFTVVLPRRVVATAEEQTDEQTDEQTAETFTVSGRA
ncbi:hypothetical protein BH24DEI2_BH24DEI2_17460 [soil metagenome]